MKTNELCEYLETFLDVRRFRDYAPNGLQVQGRDQIEHIVSGVSATAALIDQAIEHDADAILVHHGYFWKNEDPRVIGLKAKRLRALLAHDINLLAYHLPLDAHPVVGNNAQLGKLLDLKGAVLDDELAQGLVWHAHLDQPDTATNFYQFVTERLGRRPLHIPGHTREIRHIAWCTGAAQGYIDDMAAYHVDLYISGEISEQTVNVAKESGVHFIAAGHHATERYGVKALGEHLADKFELRHEFIDIDNPA